MSQATGSRAADGGSGDAPKPAARATGGRPKHHHTANGSNAPGRTAPTANPYSGCDTSMLR